MTNTKRALIAGLLSTAVLGPALADDAAWRAAMIKDALTAAPPTVTKDAAIYAWKSKGNLVKLRDGTGSYKCIASGSFSVKIGKPPLPFPDPMCLDPNAWAFVSATWSEKNPLKPTKPYPTTPGMIWMLAGMSAPGGKVAHADSPDAEYKIGVDSKKIVRLSPHIMVTPLPVKGKQSLLGHKYDTQEPYATWVMAAGTPFEHVMLHFSKEEADEIMQAK